MASTNLPSCSCPGDDLYSGPLAPEGLVDATHEGKGVYSSITTQGLLSSPRQTESREISSHSRRDDLVLALGVPKLFQSWEATSTKHAEDVQTLGMHHTTALVVKRSRNPRIVRGVIQESRMFHIDSHRCKSGGSLGDE